MAMDDIVTLPSSQPILRGVDPDVLAPLDARANEIANGASTTAPVAALLALGSVPIAIGALAREVYGQAPSDVIDVLQFALLLEYLEADFYQRGIAAAGLIPTADRTIFTTISSHETAHVTAIQALLQRRATPPRSRPAFDFTGKGAVAGFAFLPTQYGTFQMLAQAFEDTGVRAYKGQAGRLINDKVVLTAALSIHSVEARHAAMVRRLRGRKGWISANSRDDLPTFAQAVYDGEETTTHVGINVAGIPGSVGGTSGITEAFDEPLTMAQVTAIITPFLV